MLRPEFDFSALDSMLRANVRGRPLPPPSSYEADRIGPLLEMKHATRGLASAERTSLEATVASLAPVTRALRISGITDPRAYDSFRIDAHKAALGAGFQSTTASKIIAALSELASNVLEHSEHPRSGRIAYRANLHGFEFVVADLGIGPLASLRKYQGHAHLSGHGDALRLMVDQGVSRYGPGSGRGFGYRPLFVWLANLSGHLRFRTGDQAFELDGRFGDTLQVRLSQKPAVNGYFASVYCSGPA